MTRTARQSPLMLGATICVVLSTSMPVLAEAQGSATIVPHRAVYDLRLLNTRGKQPMRAVRGRILYDFKGSACEGYSLQFRQVSQLNTGEGKVIVSDLRATSWEDGEGRRLTFHSENRLDDTLRETVTGEAVREDKSIAVQVSKPQAKAIKLDGDLLFPTQHVRRVLELAAKGQTLLQAGVYDGSEDGGKIFDTLTVIGKPIAPGEQTPDDASGKNAAFAKLRRWPVTVSYFERGKPSGEQTPVYAISMELYENGISRALKLDYNDFVVAVDMTTLELGEAKPCP